MMDNYIGCIVPEGVILHHPEF